MEEDFPRGGVVENTFSKKGRKVKEKNLFQDNEPDSEKPGRKRKRKNKKDESGSTKKQKKHKIEGDVSGQGASFHPQFLSKKMLYPNMLILGCVKHIKDYKLIVSLPNGLSGSVPINQISHAYTESLQRFSEGEDENAESVSTLSELFHVGMLVPCKLTEHEKGEDKSSLSLSIDPRSVNEDMSATHLRHGMIVYGSISSQEDHGYIVDTGIKGIQVFLKNKQADRFIRLHNNGELLKVGQCVMCKINMKGDRMSVLSGQTRVIHVTIDPVKLNSIETSTNELSFASVVPGMKVQATVDKIWKEDGVMVDFNNIKGLIHKSHLPKSPQSYSVGEHITCTVLYIHPLVKTVTLSHLPHINNYIGVPISIGDGKLNIGDVIEDGVVARVDPSHGVFMDLKSGVTGFAGKNNLSDVKIDKIGAAFKIGSIHRCRVLGHSFMEGFLYVSLKKSILEEKHLQVSDVKPGELVECVVKRLTPKGLSVELQKGIGGFIHNMHLADVTIKHPEKMFKVDDKLKCRVLSVFKDTSKVDLTHKKSLVGSKYRIISDYSEIEDGEVMEGYISQIRDAGCIVRFYDRVKGFVPKSMLSVELIEYPEKVFYIGQVVRCKVFRVDPENSKLILSFILEGRSNFGQKVDLPTDYKVGKLVKCVVEKKSQNGIDVKLHPSNKVGFIPKMHLSDSMVMNDALWEKYQPGDTIDQAMYWNKAKMAILTCKRSLIMAAQNKEEFVTEFDSLQPGMMLAGAVKNITQYGIFVEFAGGLFGLVPNQYATDTKVKNLNVIYQIGQTVNPKVVEVNKEKKRFLASLRMQDCYHGNTNIGIDLTWNLLQERNEIMEFYKKDEDLKGKLAQIAVGSIQNVNITQLTDLGAIGELHNGIKAVVINAHMKDDMKEGDTADGVVLYVDICQNCVELSLNPKLVKNVETRLKKKDMEKCRENQVMKSTILLVKEDFVMVSLSLHAGGLLAYVPAKRHWNDVLEKFQYGIRQENKVVIKRIENDVILASLKIHEDKEEEEEIEEKFQHVPTHTLQIGDIRDAVVRKIYKDQIYINIEGTSGRVHVTQMFDSVNDGAVPVSQFRLKQVVKVRVIGFREPVSLRCLPISHPNQKNASPECSMKPSVLEMKQIPDNYLSDKVNLKIGDGVVALATRIFGEYLWVQVSPTVQGKVHCMNMKPEVLKMNKTFEAGHCYNATVTSIINDHLVELNMLDTSQDIVIGETIRGMVFSAKNDVGLTVLLHGGYKGVVDVTDMSDNYTNFPAKQYKQRSFVTGLVIECDRAAKQAVMSLRPEDGEPVDRRITKVTDLSPGQLVRGYITRVTRKLLTVRLGINIKSNVLSTELIEGMKISGMGSFFKVGTVVTAKIIGFDNDNELLVSLLKKDTGVDLKIPKHLVKPLDAKDLKRKRSVSCSSVDSESAVETKKAKLKNTERTVNENVELEISGCEEMDAGNDMSDNPPSDSEEEEIMDVGMNEVNNEKNMLDELVELGKRKAESDSSGDIDDQTGQSKLKVISKVNKKDKNDRKKSNSAKKKTAKDESEGSEDSEDEKQKSDKKKKRKKRKPRQKSENIEEAAKDVSKSTDEKVNVQRQSVNDNNDETDSDKESDSGIEVKVIAQSTNQGSGKPVLELTEKFSWDTEFKMPSKKEEESSDDSDDDTEKPVKKTREQIREAKIAEEKHLYEIEMKRLEGEVKPETIDDFDRLALQSPDSSIIWLRYMAFHLETTEIDKARAVAERALKTISFREEQEKLNVWVAYLNLENMYGTTESLKKVLDRAVQQNDQISIYLKMINIYVQSGKIEEAEQLFNILVKKHSANKDIWIKYGEFYFNQNRIDSARKLLQRSLKSLNVRLHVDIITKFAQMEFKLGEAERGKTMFENILSTYPKRTDLWSVYIDMMTRLGDHGATRALYDRVVGHKMSAKKMKFFFKKYLQFEEKYGTEDHVAAVKKKALKYVESQGYVDEV